VVSGSDRSLSSFWPSSFSYFTYGSNSDAWGNSLTPAIINNSNFGIAISAKSVSSSSQAVNIDAIRLTVYYTHTAPGVDYFNNPSTADGATAVSSANDPSDSGFSSSAQYYLESSPFNNRLEIGGSTEGLWDISLYDNSAPAGTTYCFRTVKSDGTPLDTYTNYPMITTYTQGPTMDQVMRGGEWFSGGAKQPFFWAQ
jgi:hypothetical protein